MPILPAARTPVRCSALCGVLVNHSLFGVCPHATQLTVTSIIAPSMKYSLFILAPSVMYIVSLPTLLSATSKCNEHHTNKPV